ncbi:MULTISPECIES: ABC transporter permease [Bacillus]|uniref:ABC transporter permease n=2 Tax=Bacillus TaxID=1386 RepID=A0A0M4FUY6_9BACI|nr:MULTISPECIES: ABC transporter permease [Bacillus]ALC80388.1 ABC transporter permease [Bacillus gobiensis]MBP1083762.1 ABC-2 type transport system permease protein [Bacillus capparidis]MED1098247.1 ABC transporter permease [Bacillus capparidis]
MRIKALVTKIIQQFFWDKRTLLLMLFAPLLVLTLANLVLNNENAVFHTGGYQLPDGLVSKLEKENIEVEDYSSNQPKSAIENDQLDAFFSFGSDGLSVTLDNSSQNTKEILGTLQRIQQPKGQSDTVSVDYAYSDDELSSFDYTGPVLVGLFIFFFVFLVAGISFLRERTKGTLERILATPLKRYEIVAGYSIGFGLFTVLQSIVITWFAIQILNLYNSGSIGLILIITILLSLTALTLGTFLSTFANNELQLIQFIPLVIVPQVFFSGLFPLDGLPSWLESVSFVMPLYYGADALKAVMLKGQGFPQIQTDLFVLIGFITAFALLNIFTLKKYRRL